MTSSCDTDLTAVVSLQESAFALGIFLGLVSSEIEDMLKCTSHSGATRQGINSTFQPEGGAGEEYSKSDTASGKQPKRSGRRPRLLHLLLKPSIAVRQRHNPSHVLQLTTCFQLETSRDRGSEMCVCFAVSRGSSYYTQAGARIPFQIDRVPDDGKQELPPPGEEPALEALATVARQTVCSMAGAGQILMNTSSPQHLRRYCAAAAKQNHGFEQVVERPQDLLPGLTARAGAWLPASGSHFLPVELPASKTPKDSFMDAISFAIRGRPDRDCAVSEALETTAHADSYVGRQVPCP